MLEEAIMVAPEDIKTRVRLAGVYRAAGNTTKVLQMCRELNNIDPFRLAHHRWWTVAAIAAKDIKTALREGGMGLLLAQTREDDATDAAKLTPEIQVETGVAWAVSGLAHVAAGDLDEAKDCLDEAIERAPDAEETAALQANYDAAKK